MQSEANQWGRHHRALIVRHARSCPLHVHQLAKLCGWANVTAFQRHQGYWRRGLAHRRARIPIAYLNAIGIDWCELIRAVERDAAEYDVALEGMSPPDSVIVHRRPFLGVTVREPIPHGLTHEERHSFIQRLVNLQASDDCRALILDWPGMKQVWFRPHEKPNEHLWRPHVVIVGEQIDFGGPSSPA